MGAFALAVASSCSDSSGRGTSATSPPTTGPPTTGQSTTGQSTAPSASTPVPPPSTAGPTSTTSVPAAAQWTTFGAAVDRRGNVASGPDAANVHQSWASSALDGDVYGQPLLSGGHVLVATEGDSVYALDAGTGAQAWRTMLGDPVPLSALECGNIDPSGITGTPVLDPATDLVYVVALVQPGRHDLVALDSHDGTVRWRRPADPPNLDPLHEQQRSALTIANGRVYVAYGGLFGDCGPYKGAVVAFALDGSGEPISWVVPTRREGGLWAPSGLAVDSAGNLYAAIGNGASSDPSQFDYGNAVVRLTPGLALADSWAPADWYSLSASDTDLGSIGPVLVDSGRVFVAGKNGTGYVLAADHLGGIGGQVHDAKVCKGGAFGGAASSGSMVVVGCSGGPSAWQIGADGALTARWHGPSARSGAPVIAGSTVWLVTNAGHLLGLDLTTGAKQADVDLGERIGGFPSPTVEAGAVYAPAGTRVVAFVSG